MQGKFVYVTRPGTLGQSDHPIPGRIGTSPQMQAVRFFKVLVASGCASALQP